VVNRLVKSNFSVLLLEAGGEIQPGQYIPSSSLLMLNKPHIDWSHLTVPQTKACQSMKNKVSPGRVTSFIKVKLCIECTEINRNNVEFIVAKWMVSREGFR